MVFDDLVDVIDLVWVCWFDGVYNVVFVGWMLGEIVWVFVVVCFWLCLFVLVALVLVKLCWWF